MMQLAAKFQLFLENSIFWTLEPTLINHTANKVFFQQVVILHEKCPNTEFFLVRIFLYSD